MLRGILFDIAPELVKSPAVIDLLNKLSLHEIHYVFYGKTGTPCATSASQDIHSLPDASSSLTETPVSVAALLQALALPSGDCLMLTDSANGIASAKAAGIPSLGYTTSEGCEDMSGAYALFEDFASIDVAYLCRTHAHAMGYPADILTTERLIVREFSNEDFSELYTMCTEPSTASFMEETLSDYDTELEKHRAYIRTVYPFFDLALWGVYEKASGKLIGRAGFSLPEDNFETFSIGYLIDAPYRKQGFAKELIPALLSYAREQGYEKISACIKQANIASVKSLEHCGYPYKYVEAPAQGTHSYIISLTL